MCGWEGPAPDVVPILLLLWLFVLLLLCGPPDPAGPIEPFNEPNGWPEGPMLVTNKKF